jgi:predicted nucleotidyltransferase
MNGSRYFITTIKIPMEVCTDGTVYAMMNKRTIENRECTYEELPLQDQIQDEQENSGEFTIDFSEMITGLKDDYRLFITKEEMSQKNKQNKKNQNITFKKTTIQQKHKPHQLYTRNNKLERLSMKEEGAVLNPK